MADHLFCFGLGYSAAALGRRLMAKGWRVSGTTREAARAEALRAEGFTVHVFNPATSPADIAAALGDARHVLISVPPGPNGDPVLGLRGPALAPLAKGWAWLGYLSTTGVYGDHGGDWVDETTALTPQSERATRRVRAEAGWQRFAAANGAPLHIFRLPGIYGPGRSAIEAVRAGTARRIDKPGQTFSRIHVDDLAAALEASMAKPEPDTIYNLCDDEPAPQAEVVAYAAELLGVAPPPLEAFDVASKTMSPMAQSFYTESKRVRNTRMKEGLGVRLRYPSYREGLKAILDDA